jgi:hypothetical protein
MKQQSIASGRRQEQRFLSELITSQLDAWEPRSLPARFRPRRAPEHQNRRLVPVLAIVVMLLLAAIAFLASQPRDLVRIVVDIGHPRPSATSPNGGTPKPRSTRPSHPAARSASPASSPTKPVATSPAPSTAAAPRDVPVSPPAQGSPDVPAAPFIPSPAPSLPGDTPSPTPLPLPSLPVDTPPLPTDSPPAVTPPLPPLPSPPELIVPPGPTSR